MSNITTLGTSVVEGAQNIVTQTINFIPNLIAAIVIFVIGWVILYHSLCVVTVSQLSLNKFSHCHKFSQNKFLSV